MIRLQQIFVGRTKELSVLEDIWLDSVDTKHENRAYVIFNSPGVGKTTLIRKFGEIIELDGRGIHFNYTCNKSFNTETEFLTDIIQEFASMLKLKEDMIFEYIEKNNKLTWIENTRNQFQNIILDTLKLETKELSMISVVLLISRLSRIIPIFYTSDEIQYFENIELSESDQTLLHYYSRFIKSFLTNQILIVLTGTQYHILRELGDNIGSPLRGKIKSMVISPLTSVDITDYIEQLKSLIQGSFEYLHRYLQTFSGGHGRTIAKIVEQFLEYYDVRYKEIVDYTEFEEVFTGDLIEVLVGLEISTQKREEIKKLQTRKHFDTVRRWINRGMDTNLKLGKTVQITPFSENIDRNNIIYKFMTIGIITQNGNNDYYITSYFHYLTFLDLIIGEYEAFILEVMNNKYFRLIVGGHSGFGYTFENVILAIIIINSNRVEDFPFEISRIERLSAEIDYNVLRYESGLLYHTPATKNIDAVTLIDDFIAVFQITTMRIVTEDKLNRFIQEMDLIEKSTCKKVRGWFVSLFELPFEIEMDELNIIHGQDLVKFMNYEVYDKLVEIKNEI